MQTPTKSIRTFRGLAVYRCAFDIQQQLFQATRKWPREETYSLTDQLRRSSRSIGANIAEAWAKRRYPAHFLSKLTDADGELQETMHWLITSAECAYISAVEFRDYESNLQRIGGMLGKMIAMYDKFCLR